jgi:anti-sigma factor ChrR (cupin superfamily)
MKLMISCREARERLTEYTEGTLSWRGRLALRWHLLICGACNAFYRGLKALPAAARFLLEPVEPPAEAAHALEAALRRLREPRDR